MMKRQFELRKEETRAIHESVCPPSPDSQALLRYVQEMRLVGNATFTATRNGKENVGGDPETSSVSCFFLLLYCR